MLWNRRFQRTLIGLIGILAVDATRSSHLAAQCRSNDLAAAPFGPPFTAADSGRVYTSLISGDGREFYFFKRVGAVGEDYRIFRSIRSNSGWGPAEQLNLGGNYSDLYPSLSPDGSRLVFGSYRPAPGDTAKHPNAHLWMARRTGNGWTNPEFVRASQLGHYHSGLKQDAEGTLHFRLTTPDWNSARDVALRWNGSAFAAAVVDAPLIGAVAYWRRQLGDSVHLWGAVEGPNGLALLSVSKVIQPRGSRSPAQYFVTVSRSGAWTPLVRAGGGLGEGSPNFAWFSADGCSVIYTRDYSQFMTVPVSVVVGGR